MIRLTFILIFNSLFLLTCQNSPTFNPENELDPAFPGFTLTPPQRPKITRTNIAFAETRLVVGWNADDSYRDGFIIEKFNFDENKFSEIGRVSNREFRYIDEESNEGLMFRYRILSFAQVSSDSIKTSESVEISFNHKIDAININPILKNRLIIALSHSIFSNDLKLFLQRKIGNQDFELITELTEDEAEYIDSFDIPVDTPIEYRTFAYSSGHYSDTLYSESYILQLVPPNQIDIVESSSESITLDIYHIAFADRFILKLLNHDGSLVNKKVVEIDPNNEFTHVNFSIPNTREEYKLEIFSELNNELSSPAEKSVRLIPDLKLEKSRQLENELYTPSLSLDGRYISFQVQNNQTSKFKPEIWDANELEAFTKLPITYFDTKPFFFEHITQKFYLADENKLQEWSIGENPELLKEISFQTNNRFQRFFVNPTNEKAYLGGFSRAIEILDLNTSNIEQKIGNGDRQFYISSDYKYIIDTSFRPTYTEIIDTENFSSHTINYSDEDFPAYAEVLDNIWYVWGPNLGLVVYSLSTSEVINAASNYNDDENDNYKGVYLESYDLLLIYDGPYFSTGISFIDTETNSFIKRIDRSELEKNSSVAFSDEANLFHSKSLDKVFLVDRYSIAQYEIYFKWGLN